MKQSITALCIILLLCFACRKPPMKEPAPKSLTVTAIDTAASYADMPAANPQNPYDSYGVLHNEGMDYVRTKMKEAGETRPESVTKYVQQFAMVKTGQPDNNDYYSVYQRLMQDSAKFYTGLIEKANLSPSGKLYLRLIFHVITKRASSDTFVYKDVKAEIIEIENRITKDVSLPSYDYKELFKAASLARYSSYYWTQNLPMTKSIFGGIVAGIVGICSDLSALDPLCGSFLNWMTGGDFDPIGVSGIMYYAL